MSWVFCAEVFPHTLSVVMAVTSVRCAGCIALGQSASVGRRWASCWYSMMSEVCQCEREILGHVAKVSCELSEVNRDGNILILHSGSPAPLRPLACWAFNCLLFLIGF